MYFYSLLIGIVDEFIKAQEKLQQLPMGEMMTFSDYQAKTFTMCKTIVKNTQEIVSNANNKPSEIMTSSRELSSSYNKLVDSIQGAVATIESDDVSTQSHVLYIIRVYHLHVHVHFVLSKHSLYYVHVYFRLLVVFIKLFKFLVIPVFSWSETVL